MTARVYKKQVTVWPIPWDLPTVEELALVVLIGRLGTERARAAIERIERLTALLTEAE